MFAAASVHAVGAADAGVEELTPDPATTREMSAAAAPARLMLRPILVALSVRIRG
jgi:hypothetical protein